MVFTEVSDSGRSGQSFESKDSLSALFWKDASLTSSFEKIGSKSSDSDVMKSFGDLILFAQVDEKTQSAQFVKEPSEARSNDFKERTGLKLDNVLSEIEKGGKEPEEALLQEIGTHRLTVLGEVHPQGTGSEENFSRKFLASNMEGLKAKGVTTIVLETNRSQQGAVSEYAINKDASRDADLAAKLPAEIRNSPMELKILKEAAKLNISIVCGDARDEDPRLIARNQTMKSILQEHLLNGEKIVMLVGSAHQITDQERGIFGVSDQLVDSMVLKPEQVFSTCEITKPLGDLRFAPIIDSIENPVLVKVSEMPTFSQIQRPEHPYISLPRRSYNKFDALIMDGK